MCDKYKYVGCGPFFAIMHDTEMLLPYGGLYIVPSMYGITTDNHVPQLTHDCASFEEFNVAIDNMIDDLERIRSKGKKYFEKLRKKSRR